jgi:hypothetical protein
MREPYPEWRSPRPLWPRILSRNGTAVRAATLARPTLLRFDTDTFMDDFVRVLERDPAQLDGFVARPETWRRPSQLPAGLQALLEAAGPLTIGKRRRALAGVAGNGGAGVGVGSGSGIEAAAGSGTGPTGSATVAAERVGADPSGPLKLYHPAHGRYYLVTSSLVCRLVGLPDRRLDPVRDERATFVVRRLLPAQLPPAGEPLPPVDQGAWNEHAFVKGPDGPRWRPVADTAGGGAAVLVDGEERNPLFASRYSDEGRTDRRMFAGLVPVGAREAYMGAPLGAAIEGDGDGTGGAGDVAAGGVDPRVALFRTQVLEPWRSLIRQARGVRRTAQESRSGLTELDGDYTGDDTDAAETLSSVRSQIQTGSWYILLDLADFLRVELPDAWDAVEHPSGGPSSPGSVPTALEMTVQLGDTFDDSLISHTVADVEDSLAHALRAVAAGEGWEGRGGSATLGTPGAVRTSLESATAAYDRNASAPEWPDFLFPLVDMDDASTGETDAFIDNVEDALDALRDAVEAELVRAPVSGSYPDLPQMAPEAADRRDGWFVIRCVFERPGCGPVKPPLVGAATVPFRMAAFFDPDAPARRIRIPMPLDTTPAGLRKFAKNTVFEFSSVLCGQVDALRGFTFMDLVLSVLPWPFHKPLDVGKVGLCTDGDGESGMACSLSIPIVTICALILVIMIVTLLDQIFRWVPFFIACFRIPGLKGKNA